MDLGTAAADFDAAVRDSAAQRVFLMPRDL